MVTAMCVRIHTQPSKTPTSSMSLMPSICTDRLRGVSLPLRDVQEAASHADPRTTVRYDRARQSLDRHATYIVAAFVAGAAR
jgi:hypothetical protein